jgi:THO complex subunit 2
VFDLLSNCSSGRFLADILSDLLKWYKDEALYLSDNRSKVGGKSVYHPGMQRTWTNKPVTLDSLLSWADFQKILRKWHKKLLKVSPNEIPEREAANPNLQCFIDCLQTGEFMHVYNSIIIMKELLPVFPLASVTDTGASLDQAVDRLLQTEKRGDLTTLTKAYSASLKKKESDWAMPKARVRTFYLKFILY